QINSILICPVPIKGPDSSEYLFFVFWDQKKGAVRGTAPTPFTVFRPEPVAVHEESNSVEFLVQILL
ncbi:MAG: hypothetical protein QNK19_12585, partial [Xanthomonadales bacterium]|nr:hypothetical protein [Xanthomonadales bacterium]